MVLKRNLPSAEAIMARAGKRLADQPTAGWSTDAASWGWREWLVAEVAVAADRAKREQERHVDQAVMTALNMGLLHFMARCLRDIWFLWRHGVLPPKDDGSV